MLEQVLLQVQGATAFDQQGDLFQADGATEVVLLVDDEGVVLVHRLQLLADHLRVRRLAVVHEQRNAVGHELAGGEIAAAVDRVEEVAHVVVGRILDDLLGRAHLDQLAAFHDADARTDAHGFLDVVGDEDDGAAVLLLQVQQDILHLAALERVEGGEGLVHDDHRGVDRQGAGQADALLHATGQLMGILVREAGQADLLQHFHGAPLALLLALAGHFQAEGGVVQHAARGHQGEGLEHHAHVATAQVDQLRLGQLGDVLAVDEHIAGGGFDQAVDQADQGRLARARQPHQHEDLAFIDAERHVADADHGTTLGEDLLLAPALLE
ncbi:hypothetical protein D3C81_1182850 [compost metagenome]